MSQKVTAKNLQYTSTLPPFLARLRGQTASENDPNAPDPILAARRRPAKPRSGSAEAEDAPLVVDERGNTVEDVAVGADGSVRERGYTGPQQGSEMTSAATEEGKDEEHGHGAAGNNSALPSAAGNLAGIGDSSQRRKRKIGRVVGAAAEEEEVVVVDEEQDSNRNDGKVGKGRVGGAKPETDSTTAASAGDRDVPTAAAKAKAKKKAKKIKLSFGDDEG